jgi:hypothetical protein
MHRRLRRIAPAVAAAALTALLVSALSASASPPPPPQQYAVVIAPGAPGTQPEVDGGTTIAMTATITDGTAGPLRSLQLLPPAGLTVQSASLPAGMIQPTITQCSSGAGMVPCVAFGSFSLTPGKSVVVTMMVSIAPACSTTDRAWTTLASKPLYSASALTTHVVDICTLHYPTTPPDPTDTQPHNVAIGDQITVKPDDPTAKPFAVDILDKQGKLVTSSSAPVTVTLSSNPGSATLSGMTTENASGGVATFPGLSLDKAGDGYTLLTSSPGMTSTTSAAFDAAPGTPCPPCTSSASTPQGSSTVTASGAGGTSGILVQSVNPPGSSPLTCAGYTSMDPNTYEFFTTNEALTKVVTLTITQPIGAPPYDPRDTDGFSRPGGDGDGDYDDVLWNSQICFQAPYDFTARGGSLAAATVPADGTFTGLLPDCPVAGGGPCHDRAHDAVVRSTSSPVGYKIVLTANIPGGLLGDPRLN